MSQDGGTPARSLPAEPSGESAAMGDLMTAASIPAAHSTMGSSTPPAPTLGQPGAPAPSAAPPTTTTPPTMSSTRRQYEGPGSPAVKRAKMGELPAPNVVYEQWDQHAIFRELARVKAQVTNLTSYVQELAGKHNIFLEDTATALAVRKDKIEQVEGVVRGQRDVLVELDRKLTASEAWAAAHDGRMAQLEKEIVKVVETHVQQQLTKGMAHTIEEHVRQTAAAMKAEVQQKVTEDLGEKASATVTNIRIQQAGLEEAMLRTGTEVAAHGAALAAMQSDAQRLQSAVEVMHDEHTRTACPCVSGRCPCKCNRDPLVGACPWEAGRNAQRGAQPAPASAPAAPGPQTFGLQTPPGIGR